MSQIKLHLNSFSSQKKTAPIFVNSLEKQTFSYRVLKTLKKKKRGVFCGDSTLVSSLDNFGLKLQYNKIYTSSVEVSKTKKKSILKNNLQSFFSTKVFSHDFQKKIGKSFGTRHKKFKLSSFKKLRLKTGITDFENSTNLLVSTCRSKFFKKEDFLFFLKTRAFLKRSTRVRLFSYALSHKVRYQSVLSRISKNPLETKFLLTKYLVDRLTFLKTKKRRKPVFKKFAWKRRKLRKWKNFSVFNRFKNRQRFYRKFYVPRHFEINYKTLNLVSLGFFDSKSTDSKIPFWLNLRKLTTFFSL